jgi:hypothetical protein
MVFFDHTRELCRKPWEVEPVSPVMCCATEWVRKCNLAKPIPGFLPDLTVGR